MENNSEQVSTKEFLRSVFSYFQFLGRNWQILLICLLGGNLYDQLNNNYFEDTDRFGGAIEFNIDLEGGGAGAGQMGGFASAFGLPGGTNNSGLLDASNFTKIFLSKAVFQKALMTEVDLYGRTDLFANLFVDSSDIKTKEWGGNFFRDPSGFVNIKFVKKDPKDFTLDENKAITDIYNKLFDNTSIEKEEGTSIYKVQAVLSNELLTKAWLETLLKATEEFYTSMRSAKTYKLMDIQRHRVDSLSRLLGKNDRSLAVAVHEQPDVVNPYAGVNTTRVTRDNTFLNTQYLAALNSLESLKSLLVEQSQVFHILTPVDLPLVPGVRYGISTRLTGLILLVAAIFIMTMRRSFLDIMSDKE